VRARYVTWLLTTSLAQRKIRSEAVICSSRVEEERARGVTSTLRSPAASPQPLLREGTPWQRFAVIGDTFTAQPSAGGRNRPGQSWADKVCTELRQRQPDLAYLNLSRRNFASSQVRASQLQRMLAFVPDLAAISFGFDEAMSDSFDIGRFESELVRILLALRHIDCTVLIIGIFDITSPRMPSARKAQIQQQIELVSSRTSGVAMRFGAIYVDMAARVTRDGACYSDDGGRLNSHGHEIIADETIHQLDDYLRKSDY
jgi:hypothetical protein